MRVGVTSGQVTQGLPREADKILSFHLPAVCLDKSPNFSAPVFSCASCSGEMCGVPSGTVCLLGPHTLSARSSQRLCFHACPRSICVFSIGGAPLSHPDPVSPLLTSFFMSPVCFCLKPTSEKLAFLSSVLHQYLALSSFP